MWASYSGRFGLTAASRSVATRSPSRATVAVEVETSAALFFRRLSR